MTGSRLEEMARAFRGRRTSDAGPSSEIAAEIAMLSERLDRVRDNHETRLGRLDEDCSRIRVCLRQLESYVPRIHVYRGMPRENLKKDLTRLGREQRSLALAHEARIDALHDRLMELLRQHAVLSGSWP